MARMSAAATASVYRSPADLLRLVVALVVVVALLVVDRLFGNAVLSFLADVLSGVARLPAWMLTGVIIGTRVLTSVILVGGLVAVLWQHRLRLLVMAVLGAVAGAVLASVLCALLGESGSTTVPITSSLGYVSDVQYPSRIGLAAAAGAVTACAPWLSRRWRRLAWTMLVGLTVSRFVTAPVSFDSAMALAGGWLAGAGLLLATGGPVRRPNVDAVIDGLASVGLPLAELRPADVDARGSTPYFGSTEDGRGVFVKVLGTDERDADILFRLYRRFQPRNLGDEKPFSSLRRTVEHEALVSLTARSLGLPTPSMLAFASVEPNAFVLAYAAIDGTSLDRVDGSELTDEVVTELWRQLDDLRSHRIAHRDLRLANLFLAADGHVMLIDFGFSELSASDLLLATDLAELLASLALAIGPERSCCSAVAIVGDNILRSALPRLKPFALSGATRSGLKAQPDILPELRRQISARTEPDAASSPE
jgi:undecaprenyl-diphosphatase